MNAAEQIAAAIEEHGQPKWVCHVPMSVRAQVSNETKRELLATAKVSIGWAKQGDRLIFGRLDAREALRQWATQHIFEILTVKQIAESADVAQSAVRTMIEERPDIFRKSEGRTFEIRDPQEDRKTDKR